MDISENYYGREHSYIKHKLLRGYLEKLFYIKALSGSKELTYVDCFAGPWGSNEQDLSDTSISISLDLIKNIRESLATRKLYDVSFKAIYVEESKTSFERLKAFLDNNATSRVTTYPIHGDYSNVHREILGVCQDSFTLFFFDPTGWTPISIDRLKPFLQRKNSEFLITFMYDFLNRAIGIRELRDTVTSVLGAISEDEIEELQELSSTKREDRIVRKYRDTLSREMKLNNMNRPRSYHLKVLDRKKERTKYHLVYLSRHPRGIIEFARQSENMDIVQRIIRFETIQRIGGQIDIFGLDDKALCTQISGSVSEVRAYWLNKLDVKAIRYDNESLADMLEETGWYEVDLQRSFAELENEKKVENLDSSRKRPKRPVHFEKAERLRRVK